MKKSLEDWKEEYEYYSSTASQISRSLGLGGVAIVWIFKNSNENDLLPDALFWPLLLCVMSLFLDLMQYLIGTAIWWPFYLWHEKNTPEKKHADIKANPWYAYIISAFWILKMVALMAAYIVIIIFLIPKI